VQAPDLAIARPWPPFLWAGHRCAGSVLPTRRLVRDHTSRRASEMPARAGLFGIAARRDCPFHPPPASRGRRRRLVSVAL